MKYKVTFRQRFNEEGEASDAPDALVDGPEGVVLDKLLVERIEPASLHVEDRMEEDDDFFPFGTSSYVYDVADGRDDDFKKALAATGMVLHVEEFQETPEYLT
jgi:hypothetical protein